MGETLSRKQFATLAGVTGGAIGAAAKRGTLFVGPDDRLDPDHPKNAAYLQARKVRGAVGLRQHQRVKTGSPEKPKPTRQTTGNKTKDKSPRKAKTIQPRAAEQQIVVPIPAYPAEAEAELYNFAALQDQKDREDILLKRARREMLVVQKAERLGLLVEKVIVEQKLAALGADLNVRLLQLPRRIGPQLCALVEAGKGDRVEQTLERELSDVIKRAKKAGKLAGN